MDISSRGRVRASVRAILRGYPPTQIPLLVVGRLDGAQLREHLITKVFGRALAAGPRQDIGEGLGNESLVAASGAFLQMLANVGVLRLAHFVSQVLLEVSPRLVTTAIGHFFAPGLAETMPRSCAYSASISRSNRLPR
ncbi:hypothetical protein MIC448_2540003 [Microbacterium sp. C448]|nr:hypothetical protein MIC448_2540003 [Microbacterium sp. C448]